MSKNIIKKLLLKNALDSKTGDDVLALFEELNAMGHTIIMITHDQKVGHHAERAGIVTDYIEVNDQPPNRQIIGKSSFLENSPAV